MKIDDVVKTHVQVQSRAKTGAVDKLRYRARYSFVITANIGNTSFKVQRCGDPISTARKEKDTE